MRHRRAGVSVFYVALVPSISRISTIVATEVETAEFQ
jgi:hypothetical protein